MLRALRNLLAIAAALAALGFVVVGCGDDDDEDTTAQTTTPARELPKGSFVGKVQRSDAFIAVVSDGKQVDGYLCDGTEEGGVEVSVWFADDRLSTGTANFENRDGELVGFAAEHDKNEIGGQIDIDGKSHPFTATRASGDAGLYRAIKGKVGEPGTVEAGWIVLNDGNQRGGTNFIDPANDLNVQRAPFIIPEVDNAVIAPQAGRLRVTKFIDPLAD